MRRRALRRLLAVFILIILVASCDGSQTVCLTTEDFRFVPDLVRASSSGPLTLTVFNAGREVHEFDSSVLVYAPESEPTHAGRSDNSGIVLAPGQSVRLVMAPPPGTYLYICRRKGHANMTGTLIVE